MHIHNRLPIVVAALLLLLPLAVVRLGADLLVRSEVAQQYNSAAQTALEQKQMALKTLNDWRLESEHKKLVGTTLHEIERERRKLSRQIQNMQEILTVEHASAPEEPLKASALAKKLHNARFSQELSEIKANRMLQKLVYEAGMHTQRSLPLALNSIYAAEHVIALRQQDNALMKKQQLVSADFDRNEKRVRASTQQLAAAREMMRQMQEVVFALQTHLERIDAQIQRRQERQGILQGTLDPQRNKYEEARGRAFEPHWPARARVSAGFHDEGYREFFGIPHNGIDIVVPQGSPVRAADDGVVFSAHDGGTGYSYVLIGHRGGFATLYGHLSQIDVHTGDSVSEGQVVGLSGGGKGTPGAGLVTTGSHLHFEIIHNGNHIDPQTLLP